MPITVTVQSDYPINLATAAWFVNGQFVKRAGPPVTGPPNPPVTCGPYTYTWIETAQNINVTSSKFVVEFVCQETGLLVAGCATAGVPLPVFAFGVNRCWF